MKGKVYTYLLQISITLLVGSVALSVQGQDIHFSQLSETPLLRNPALAGLFSGDVRIQTVYRSQWNSFTDAYKTGSVNAEFKLPIGRKNDFVTIGGQVLYDRAGTVALSATHVLPMINLHKSLSDERNMYLSMAVMGGLVQRRIDRSKITTDSQFDGTGYVPGSSTGESFTRNSYSYGDATVGMSFNTQLGSNEDNNIYAGVAYHHFTKPKNVAFYSNYDIEMSPKIVYSIGVRTSFSENAYITLEGDFSKQGSFTNMIGGIVISRKIGDIADPKYLFHIGSYYRYNDALVPVVKLETKPLAFSLSYDINMSNLRQASFGRGGMEASIIYQSFHSGRYSSRDDLRCPRF